MRRAAKVDSNHLEIVLALKQAGYLVSRVSDKALPDLWLTDPRAAHCGWLPLEVKRADGVLTPAQERWHENHRGTAVRVVRSVEEALAVAHKHFGRANGSSGVGNG